MKMKRETTAQYAIRGVPYHMWQNAMRMSIEDYKRSIEKNKGEDFSKRNWLVFKLRLDGKNLKEIGEMLDLSPNRIRVIEVNCSRAILKNIRKLKQRSQKHGRAAVR